MEKIIILGVKIDSLTKKEALARLDCFFSDGHQHLVFTPNPEIILEASKDEELFYILNQASLSLPDGFGLKLASFLNGKKLERITGADLSVELLEKCETEGRPVAFVIWDQGLSSAQDLMISLKEKYPKLVFSVQAVSRGVDFSPNDDFLAVEPQLVFISLGCPWQEKLAHKSLSIIKSAKIFLGVGGAIDFITGKTKRAPKVIRSLGLEWFWRLLLNPKRAKRIFNAVFVFAWRVLESSFIQPWLYRLSVSCLLYKKKKDGKYQILLVERQGEPGHWQLPQGGTDGEALLKAGERELREELNTNRFIPKRVFNQLYRYDFGSGLGKKKQESSSRLRHTGYKGQRQGLFIAEFVGQDDDIKINFWDHSAWKWVDSDDLVNEVHLVRRRAADIFLKKFKEFVKQK